MAFFTGRSGDSGLAMQRYEAALAAKDRLNLRRNAADFIDEHPRADAQPIMQPSGAKPGMHSIAQPAAPAPRSPYPDDGAPYAPADPAAARPQAGVQLPSRVGTMDAPGVKQVQADSTIPMQGVQRFVAGGDVQNFIQQARDEMATGRFEGVPATSPLARGWAWLTEPANSPTHETRAAALEATNWVASDDFAAVIRNDPNRIAEFNADPIAFYKKYSSQAASVPGASGVTNYTAASGSPGVRMPMPDMSTPYAQADLQQKAAAMQQIESSGNPNAVSSAGAISAMQVLPSTAKDPGVPGVRPAADTSVAEAARVGQELIAAYDKRYQGDNTRIAVAYHAGMGFADNWDGDLATLGPKTRNHAKKFLAELAAGKTPKFSAAGQSSSASTTIKDNTGATRKIVAQQKAGIAELPAGAARDAATKKSPPPPKVQVDVELVNTELNTAAVARKKLFMVADAYRRAGMGKEYIEALGALNNMTATMVNLAQQKAINLFESNGDPRMLQQMWSKKSGRSITIHPRPDGKWNVMDGDQMINEGVTTADITSPARATNSSEHAKSIRAAATEAVAAHQADTRKLEATVVEKKLDSFTALMKQRLANEGDKQSDGSGGMFMVRGGRVIHVSSDGVITGPDGETSTGVVAKSAALPGGAGSMTSIMDQARARVGN